MNVNRLSRHVLAVLMLMCVTAIAQPLHPTLEFLFNETGSTAANTGSAGGYADLITFEGTGADLHTADGGGLSGLSGDRSFDLTSATRMGGYGGNTPEPEGPAASMTGGSAHLNGATSFTVTGWMKPDGEEFGRHARLMQSNQFSIWGVNGIMDLSFGGDNVASSDAVFTGHGEWVYFAVAYDGTQSEDNIRFYRGTETGEALLVGTRSLDVGTIGTSTAAITIGNWAERTRTMKGLIDNFRIFTVTDGSGGALSGSSIEQYREWDIANIPEPHLIVPGAALLALAGRLRRRRRT